MLVFTRRKGQKVVVVTPQGEKIILHILRTRDNDVRVAFDAPQSFQIDRFEVHEDRIKNLYLQKQSATNESIK